MAKVDREQEKFKGNREHLDVLLDAIEKEDILIWNDWRAENPSITPNLSWINLRRANLRDADLKGADLKGAILNDTTLSNTDLRGTDLVKANLILAFLYSTKLRGADLTGANLAGANLREADLSKAILENARLDGTSFIDTNLKGCKLENCKIYGISAWNIETDEKTEQKNLIITKRGEPVLTVDNIKIAQFIYLLLNNSELREVIDTMTGKAVLILGRFGDGRKQILDSMADWLRDNNLLPIIMDFSQPDNKDFTETVRTLAGLCKYVIVDLTFPQSVPYELATIAKEVELPIVPLIESGNQEFSMFRNLYKFHWVLPKVEYKNQENLVEIMQKKIIRPAEEKLEEIRGLKSER